MAHILAPYDPAWPERFASLAARIGWQPDA
jgi:GrpB-like predicted nucleotidyltransferase (UPF0157 family)